MNVFSHVSSGLAQRLPAGSAVRLAAIALAGAFITAPAVAYERVAAPENAAVFFISPSDGDTVTSPVTFIFGLEGMGVAPAGVEHAHTGHHHLLININPADIDFNMGIIADEQHIHFGGGQTEATLEIPAGTHTFFLLMGDHNHVPHDPPVMSEVITLTVN